MTSRVLAASCPDRTRSGRAGFTIVELLVVIGILAVLASIIIAAVNHSRRAAATIKVKSDLQAVAMAMEAYKADFRRYPVRTVASESWILARALVGPDNDDGQLGSGFKTPGGSKIWPSYLPADRFRVQRVAESPANSGIWVQSDTSKQWALLDTYGNPIQYYPKRTVFRNDDPTKLAVKLVGPYLSTRDCIYEVTDGSIPADSLRFALGDKSLSGQIDGAEVLRFAGDYILASPGPDGRWLKKSDDPTSVDDAFNFDL